VTALDVARAAGVSKWTVTRAFKPGASIAEDSRRRVMAVADGLGYRPNLLARSLATRSTQLVAVLVDDFANPYKLPFLEALTASLQSEGMLAILININEAHGHVGALMDAAQRQIDAAILLGTDFHDEMLLDGGHTNAMPNLFVLARESTIASVPSVACDAPASIEEIGGHLLRKGYRRPGFMSGPRTLSTALGRRRGFAAFWRRHGVADLPELPAGTYSRPAGAEALRAYLSRTPPAERVDVLMCENDILAFGAMDVARSEFRLKIPDDLALVGYDDNEFAAAPAYDLTTYRQPIEAMVAAVVDMIRGKARHESVRLRGRFVERGSA
jgi:DNA-binding LacI/PurR family transcriptional regulator